MMLKYLEPQRGHQRQRNKKTTPTKNITTQLQDGAFGKFSTFTLPLKIEFVIDSGTLQ